MLTFETHGQEINRLHLLANQMASDAVSHARSAGLLLLEVKQGMKHGKFLHWVRENAKVSLRQAQRYMAVAQGKTMPLRRLIERSDTVSLLGSSKANGSLGLWIGDRWEPEQGFMYLFDEGDSSYWVTPANNGAFHVCKLYSGERLSSTGMYWRYTVLAEITDPDVGSDFYIGTRYPLTLKASIHDVLATYGLIDLKNSLTLGFPVAKPCKRPYCEPETSNWYWDGDHDEGEFFQMLLKGGWVNEHRAITLY